MITLYGIKSCDTVRRARRWLDQHGVEFRYHDLREDGLDGATVRGWIDQLGLDTLVNRRSASWKALPAPTRAHLDPATARDCILAHPTLVRRPLLDTGSSLHAGFSAGDYARLLERHTL